MHGLAQVREHVLGVPVVRAVLHRGVPGRAQGRGRLAGARQLLVFPSCRCGNLKWCLEEGLDVCLEAIALAYVQRETRMGLAMFPPRLAT